MKPSREKFRKVLILVPLSLISPSTKNFTLNLIPFLHYSLPTAAFLALGILILRILAAEIPRNLGRILAAEIPRDLGRILAAEI